MSTPGTAEKPVASTKKGTGRKAGRPSGSKAKKESHFELSDEDSGVTVTPQQKKKKCLLLFVH